MTDYTTWDERDFIAELQKRDRILARGANRIVILDYTHKKVLGRQIPALEDDDRDGDDQFEAICEQEGLEASDCYFIAGHDFLVDIDFTKMTATNI